MKKLYTTLLLWLFRPVISEILDRRSGAEYLKAAVMSPGDILVLQSATSMPAPHGLRELMAEVDERLGIKTLVLHAPLYAAGIIKLN